MQKYGKSNKNIIANENGIYYIKYQLWITKEWLTSFPRLATQLVTASELLGLPSITEHGRDSDWTRYAFIARSPQKYYFILNSFTLQNKGKDVRSPFQMKTLLGSNAFPSVTKVKTPGSKRNTGESL